MVSPSELISTAPTRIGALIARAARSIWAAASALRSGSMSLEFSGQITRSGCGLRPAATSAASCSVTRTWLSSTARRWALNSRPSRGTLPCTAAMVATRSGPPPPCGGTSAASGPATRASTSSPAGSANDRGRSCPVTARRTSSPRASPASTVPNDSSGSPPIAASGSSGPSGWPNPTRPQGSPPNGTRPRRASPATQTAAPSGTAPGSRPASAIPAPARPTNSASTTHSATHGAGPTRLPIQTSNGSRNPRPNRTPIPKPARGPRSRSTRPSSAKAGSASHHRVRGGKLRYSSTPPPAAPTIRATNGTQRRRAVPPDVDDGSGATGSAVGTATG